MNRGPRPPLPILPPLVLCACGRRAMLELAWWHRFTVPPVAGREKVCFPCLPKRVAAETHASPDGLDYHWTRLYPGLT